jgi:exopolyphosphatase/guanosine-5'-triphosphate,3'-diphosphate pyrophosphatase
MEFHLSRDWTEGSGAPLAGPPESGRAPELNGESFQRPTFRAQQDTYAALDLGTNNCRLLIARPTYDAFRIIDAFSRIVRLGEGLGSSGRLGEAAIVRTLGALAVCRDKMRAKGVTRARLIATEACRAAENGGAFLARVTDELGVDLEIVDRETEAHLAAAGCAALADKDARSLVLFDIGGGSTEIVWLARGENGASLRDRVRVWAKSSAAMTSILRPSRPWSRMSARLWRLLLKKQQARRAATDFIC